MTDGPQPGFFRTRKVSKGDWLPVRVWIEDGERDPDTGELLSDQVMRCEIDGERADPFEGDRKTDRASTMPRYLFFRPIPEAEFNYLTAYRAHVKQHGEPADKALRYRPEKDQAA